MIRHAPKRRRFNGATRKALARQIRAAVGGESSDAQRWRVRCQTRAELRASLARWSKTLACIDVALAPRIAWARGEIGFAEMLRREAATEGR